MTNKIEECQLNKSAVPPETSTDTTTRKKGILSSPDDYISAKSFDKGLAAAIVPDYPQNFDSGAKHRVMEA